jgi:hypothetical protein
VRHQSPRLLQFWKVEEQGEDYRNGYDSQLACRAQVACSWYVFFLPINFFLLSWKECKGSNCLCREFKIQLGKGVETQFVLKVDSALEKIHEFCFDARTRQFALLFSVRV